MKKTHIKTSQFGSGLLVLRKTERNIELLEEWSRIAIKGNYHFSDDSPSKAQKYPDFSEHRHDQSISGLLGKDRGAETSNHEVQG